MMAKPEWKKTAAGLTTKTKYGTASVSKTPQVEGVSARPWTLYINDQFQDTYNSDAEAISHAEEILARPLVNKVKAEDVSTGDL
jgi:hypothetical protein